MTIKNLALAIGCCAIFWQASCNQTPDNKQDKNLSIPALLDRHESIRNGKEWDDVQNAYGSNRKALTENPSAMEPRIVLAELFMQEARITGEHPHYYPAALSVLEPVIATLGPKEAELKPREKDQLFRALSHQASIQLSLHDFTGALQTATRAVGINPYNAQIYGALVDAHVELGQYARAVEMADKMVGIRPDLRSYSRVSYLREIHGDVPGAIEALDMAVKAGLPGTEAVAWTRLTLGNLYKTYGDRAKAEQQYRLILAERPNYPFAMAALAEIEMQQKNYAEAEKYLNQAIQAIPEVGFYEQKALLYRAMGRRAEFEQLLPQMLAMMSEDEAKGHNMNLEYASFYLELAKDYDKALQYAQKEYRIRPDNIDVNRLLARIYSAQNNLEAANMHIEKASVTKSVHPELADLKR